MWEQKEIQEVSLSKLTLHSSERIKDGELSRTSRRINTATTQNNRPIQPFTRGPLAKTSIPVQKAGANGQDILFVENTLGNIKAAQTFGWQTFLYDPTHPAESSRKLMEYYCRQG